MAAPARIPSPPCLARHPFHAVKQIFQHKAGGSFPFRRMEPPAFYSFYPMFGFYPVVFHLVNRKKATEVAFHGLLL